MLLPPRMSVPLPSLRRTAPVPARLAFIVVFPVAETFMAEEEDDVTLSVLEPLIDTSEVVMASVLML